MVRRARGSARRGRLRRFLVWGSIPFLALLIAVTAVHGTRYRAELVLLKLSGRIPALSWDEILMMIPPGSGYWVDPLVKSRNPYSSIFNPYHASSDVEAGRVLFERRCSSCHGSDGKGKTGPDLVSGRLERGASDWALFRVIRHGIPGTAMPSVIASPPAVWRVVSYLRRLRSPDEIQAGERAGPVVTSPRVTFEQLRHASRDSSNWLTYSGSYDGKRHSSLAQVTAESIGRLQVKWIAQLPSTNSRVEATPLVVDGTMYLTAPPQVVLAIDARTGRQLWSYSYPLPENLELCCGNANRGLAVLDSTLYLGTLDAHLLAIDANDGHVLWDVQVADYRDGYSVTAAPLALDALVVVGVAGGEYGVRGFLDAYDARTGKLAWRFNTVPESGEPGSESWGGSSSEHGGAPTWLTGAYDPDLGLLYWGTGNPSPDFRGDERPGDNLYSNSMIALDPRTGRMRWYYQFTPHDEHDRDAVEIPVLANLDIDGAQRAVLLQANRNGFYYVLDRSNGDFIRADAFVRQTWAEGFDSVGRPKVREGSAPSLEGTLVYPGVGGGTNWMSPSYDPERRLFYVCAIERAGVFVKSRSEPERGRGEYLGSAGSTPEGIPRFTAVRALDAATGKLRWEFRAPPESNGIEFGGLLSTAGGIVFAGSDNYFFGLDAGTGAELWRRNLGGRIWAAPITYMIDGRQQVTIAAGQALATFSLDGR